MNGVKVSLTLAAIAGWFVAATLWGLQLLGGL